MSSSVVAPPLLHVHANPPPLKVWDDGSIRVGGTRLLLEHVMKEYLSGRSAEELDERFESIDLADAHAIIAYYHRHKAEVDAYLAWVAAETKRVEEEIVPLIEATGLRDKLIRMMQERDASSGS